MEARFRELLLEAVKIAEEYRVDFGLPLKPTAPVTAFRYKPSAKTSARKAGKKAATKPAEAAQPPAMPDPKVARLQKRLETAKKNPRVERGTPEDRSRP